jgi:predicted outer membrane repeat protein
MRKSSIQFRTTVGAVFSLALITAPLALLVDAAPSSAAHANARPFLAQTPRVVPPPAFTFTVNTTTDSHDATPGDGICADAGGMCSVRAAVEEADALNATVQVNVPAGNYGLTIGTSLTVTDIAGLSITGAGASTVVDGTGVAGSVFITAEGPALNGSFLALTNLSVDNGTTATDGGALNVGDSNDTAELSGVTMSGNHASSEGGAVWVDGELWATNSTFSGNSSGGEGGAIYNPGANVRLTNDTVTGNSAVFSGGGVDAADGTTAITGGSISNNTLNVPSSSEGDGGGLYAQETTVSGTTFFGNTVHPAGAATSVRAFGGAIYVDYGIGPFDSITVSGNSATGQSSSDGGGIYDADGMTLTNSTVSSNSADFGAGLENEGQGEALTNDTFSQNTATTDGGGIYDSDTSTLTNVLVTGNTAGGVGGGLYNDDALFVTGSAIVSNSANQGGGVYSDNKAQFENTTFANNAASGAGNGGGAIYNDGSPISLNYDTIVGNVADQGAGLLSNSEGGTVGSSIVFGNKTSGGAEAECFTTAADLPFGTAGHNFFGDASCAHNSFDQVGVNPMLSALGNYGGLTPSFMPLHGSPVIDAGGGSCPATDQRGVVRPQGAACDSGAVEVGQGYWMVASDGGIFTFGAASFFGSMGGKPLNKPIVGMAATPDNLGYWEVASDGGIFTFGDAGFFGSRGGQPLNSPIVGMAATSDGHGYWLVASDGGIFTYGDAVFYGSMGGHHLNAPIVGMASNPAGGGYWLVASDGGIFNFGAGAGFHGSAGGIHLNKPIVGMAATPDGGGYWLVATDGGIFNYGDAGFFGSMGGKPLNKPIVGIASTPGGGGYWEVASDGGIFSFGDAAFQGSMGGTPLNKPIVGMTGT